MHRSHGDNSVRPLKIRSAGFTLVEIMMATLVITISIVALMGTFANIQVGIQNSKARSLASNLAQEKMQIIKQLSYYKILATTVSVVNTLHEPDITYDTGYFPMETIMEGSIVFERYTYIEVAQEVSGVMTTLPFTSADTGVKLITVTVGWKQGAEYKQLQVRSIASNPETVMSNSSFTGFITNAVGGAAIQGAVINIAENVGWRAVSAANGAYSITTVPSSYSLTVSASGFFPQMRSVSVAAGASSVQSFSLSPMSSGTIRGTAWRNDHLVISQVVGSSVNFATGFDQEWVEIFNPTTWTWTMASGMNTGIIGLAYELHNQPMQIINFDYSSFTVSPGRYFLFANTTPIRAGGVVRAADAVYDPTNADYPNIIRINTDAGNDAAGIGLGWIATLTGMDEVGWKTSGNSPGFTEGAAIDQTIGLEQEEQFVRRTSTSGVTNGYGRAYDTNNNAIDFVVANPIVYPPRNTSDSETIIAGTPATGTVITVSDGLSSPTTAFITGNPPYAEFFVHSVATGSWTLFATSTTLVTSSDAVNVVANSTTSVGPLIVTTETIQGYISGRVLNALGGVITGITVSAGGVTVTAAANGNYIIPLSTGSFTVTANPNQDNTTYVSQSQTGIDVNTGQVTSNINFVLSQGGEVRGFATRDGSNALPGIAVVAMDSNSVARNQQVTGTDGRFTLFNLSTGAYTIEPILGSGETASPSTFTVTVTAGSSIFAGTFTITGAFGTVRGSVSSGGAALRTGSLIVITTSTSSGNPPTLSTNTLSTVPYYMGSSYEDGTYSIDVRGSTSTTYRIYNYKTSTSGTGFSVQASTKTGVSVLAGQTTAGWNFSW